MKYGIKYHILAPIYLIKKCVILLYTVENHLQKILITTRPLQDNFEKEMLSYKGPFSSLRKTGRFYAEIVVACKSIHFK